MRPFRRRRRRGLLLPKQQHGSASSLLNVCYFVPFFKRPSRTSGHHNCHSSNEDLILCIQPAHLWCRMDTRHNIVHSFYDSAEVCIRFMRIFLLLRPRTVIVRIVLNAKHSLLALYDKNTFPLQNAAHLMYQHGPDGLPQYPVVPFL